MQKPILQNGVKMDITKDMILFLMKITVVVIILGIESVKDIRTRKISLLPIFIGMALGVLLVIPDGF